MRNITSLILIILLAGSAFAQAPVQPATPKTPAVAAAKPAPAPAAVPPAAPTAAAPTAPQPQAAPARTPTDPIVLSNQMMITFMQRLKNGDLPEAKRIADDMIFGQEKYVDHAGTEYRSFASVMEKKVYELQQKRDGGTAKVVWVEQPIADGYYFHAMIAFQQKKVEEALELLQKAIGWDPVRSAFYAERGFMMLAQEAHPPLATIAATYLRALELADNSQDFAAALRGMGYVLIEKNDLEGALACYLVSMQHEPQHPAAVKEIDYIKLQAPLIVKNLDAGKAPGVLVQRRIPTRIDPIHSQVLTQLADELSPAKHPKELKAVLRRALMLDPKNVDLQKRLAALGK